MDRVLTHHVNVKNPRSDKVETFEPGADLPKWAAEALIAEDHAAYPERSAKADALVKLWEASKATAAAANLMAAAEMES